MEKHSPAQEEVDLAYAALVSETQAGGYELNSDRDFTRSLVVGLLTNSSRFGYRACPCRLASGDRTKDSDIVCPCDYRDSDLAEWGSCF